MVAFLPNYQQLAEEYVKQRSHEFRGATCIYRNLSVECFTYGLKTLYVNWPNLYHRSRGRGLRLTRLVLPSTICRGLSDMQPLLASTYSCQCSHSVFVDQTS